MWLWLTECARTCEALPRQSFVLRGRRLSGLLLGVSDRQLVLTLDEVGVGAELLNERIGIGWRRDLEIGVNGFARRANGCRIGSLEPACKPPLQFLQCGDSRRGWQHRAKNVHDRTQVVALHPTSCEDRPDRSSIAQRRAVLQNDCDDLHRGAWRNGLKLNFSPLAGEQSIELIGRARQIPGDLAEYASMVSSKRRDCPSTAGVVTASAQAVTGWSPLLVNCTRLLGPRW